MKEMTNEVLQLLLTDIKVATTRWRDPSLEGRLKDLKKFLDNISEEKISQELQLQIVENSATCDLIGKISNITGKTLITYLNSYRINKERLEILFSLYKERIEPHLEEFLESEYSKELKVALLRNVRKQVITEAKNLECLKLYNKINSSEPILKLEDEKFIIEKNPNYIGEILAPSGELQLFAAKLVDSPFKILSLVENPSTLLYAFLLTICKYDHPNFEGKFKNGVTKEIIEEVIKLDPHEIFERGNNIGHEFTLEEKESIIIRYPEFFTLTKITDITPRMVLAAIKQLPSNLSHLGQILNIYSQPVLDYAKNVFYNEYKPKSVEEKNSINATFAYYQTVIDERNKVIAEQANTDQIYLSLIRKNGNS